MGIGEEVIEQKGQPQAKRGKYETRRGVTGEKREEVGNASHGEKEGSTRDERKERKEKERKDGKEEERKEVLATAASAQNRTLCPPSSHRSKTKNFPTVSPSTLVANVTVSLSWLRANRASPLNPKDFTAVTVSSV